ncbi:hypothetical protein Q7P37_006036 [Cladosporium fusiforme]
MKRLCTIVLLVSLALLTLCYGRPLTVLDSLHEPDRNGTHPPALQKRMDPSHDNQRDAQIYKDAERNGARLLIMLLAEGADLARLQASGMAEPMRPPSRVSAQVAEEPMNANQVNRNIAGYEDVMRATFQDWDPQQFPKAVVQFQAVKNAYRAESTEAIFGARNHGILRTTNLRQATEQLLPYDESPLRDLIDAAWTRQEGYKIVGRWVSLTSKDKGFRIDGFARRPWPPEYAGMNKFQAITGSRRMLQFVADPCIANDVVSRLIRAVLSNKQGSQDLRQLPTVASPFVLQITDKNAWAILGAPGHRWFFGLLYNWRDILSHKVPTAVRIYRNNAATQVGMTWILEDFDAQRHRELRTVVEDELRYDLALEAGHTQGQPQAQGQPQGGQPQGAYPYPYPQQGGQSQAYGQPQGANPYPQSGDYGLGTQSKASTSEGWDGRGLAPPRKKPKTAAPKKGEEDPKSRRKKGQGKSKGKAPDRSQEPDDSPPPGPPQPPPRYTGYY